MSLLFTGLGSHREDTTVRFLYRVFGRWRISARKSVSLGGVSVLCLSAPVMFCHIRWMLVDDLFRFQHGKESI